MGAWIQKPLKTFLESFNSPRVLLSLFGLLVLLLIPSTFLPQYISVFLIPVKIILALICLNLATCTLSKFKRLRFSTLLIHIGSIVILAGGLVSSLGFVATINIYEGDTIDTVYDWSTNQDTPLGFKVHIAKIHMDIYPVAIRIGILKNGNKADLIETQTGDFFVFEDYKVQVIKLDPFAQIAHLTVASHDGKTVGTISTDGRSSLPPEFPLDFKLVAFQDPKFERMWVDMELQRDGKKLITGTSEVNHPLRWDGMQFFLTQVAFDQMGRPYAGLQISRDPGIPYVYLGFFILCIGLLLSLKRWVRMWNT